MTQNESRRGRIKKESPSDFLHRLNTAVSQRPRQFNERYDLDKIKWIREVYTQLEFDPTLKQHNAITQVNADREARGEKTYTRKTVSNMRRRISTALVGIESQQDSQSEVQQYQEELKLLLSNRSRMSPEHFRFATAFARIVIKYPHLKLDQVAQRANKQAGTSYAHRRTYRDAIELAISEVEPSEDEATISPIRAEEQSKKTLGSPAFRMLLIRGKLIQLYEATLPHSEVSLSEKQLQTLMNKWPSEGLEYKGNIVLVDPTSNQGRGGFRSI